MATQNPGAPDKRWAPNERELTVLLEEARRHRGESLWRDARRRLRRNTSAWVSLLFLVFFLGLSLFAPLLPLPSPMALDLQEEPLAPRWPWQESPRVTPEAQARKTPGAAALRAVGGLFDDGWQHRTFVDVALAANAPRAPLDPEDPAAGLAPPAIDRALAERVGRVAGRRVEAFVLPGEEPGEFVQRHALPLFESDRASETWRETGRRALLTAERLGPPGLGARLTLEARLPDGPETIERYEARHMGRVLELRVHPSGSEPGDSPLRYTLPWSAAEGAALVGLRLNGLDLPPEGGAEEIRAAAARPPEAAARTLAVELRRGDQVVNLELAGDRPLSDASGRLHERRERAVPERRAERHRDLGARVAADLAAAGDGRAVTGLSHLDGLWELGTFDRLQVELRGRLFGFWQTAPILGTDSMGRDLLSRIVWGSRISIQVSLVATLCSLLIGVTYGALSGLLGGRVDNLMMRIVDVLYSVPFIFVVIFLITLINEYRTELAERGIGYMTVFYVVIGAIYWLTMARVVRGQVLSLKNQEFIEAARVIGAGTGRILFVHLVPNVLSVVIVYLTLTIPAVMLFEAFLSFLGLGVEPPRVSWGLLAVDGKDSISAIRIYWWLVVFPAAAMGGVLLALNVLGDGLRDALDPKLRGRGV